ncbi:MAG: SRPBCC family protein [Steroidobacteraceae bacterium]
MIDLRSGLYLALAVLPLHAVAALSAWTADPAVERRLAAGEVVVQTAAAIDPERPSGRVRAAVRIKAPAETIWRIMTDCRQALLFVPALKGCRRIAAAPDGRWEDIEQEVRYSWLLPTIRYVLRFDYDRPQRIDFRRVSGDLRDEQGSWLLTQAADGSATLVEYDVYVDPGFWIPQVLVVRSLRKDLPAALKGLEDRAEGAGGHSAH